MSELLWTPQEHVGRASWGFAQQSRIRGFLGLSTVAHVAAAAVAPWLFLTFALSERQEQLVIRTVDFFPAPETAPIGPAPETRGRAGAGPSQPKAAGGAGAVKPARPATPAEPAPAAPPASAPAPAPAAESAPASPPASEPAPAPAPPAPRDVPAVPTEPRGSTPVPYAAGRPSVPAAPTAEPARGEAGQATALARDVTGRGETGPRATVDIPRDLARGGGTGGGATGGPGGAPAGGGPGGPGAGTSGRAAAGIGTGLIDTRDPDFSEYFRVIEARVRAAWKYPENLGGTTQTVKLGFSLRVDGAVDDVRVVSSTSGVMNESALTAMRKAAPFPPLPAKFRSLVGQPLVMSFTVTIK
jgi:TonB family protein